MVSNQLSMKHIKQLSNILSPFHYSAWFIDSSGVEMNQSKDIQSTSINECGHSVFPFRRYWETYSSKKWRLRQFPNVAQSWMALIHFNPCFSHNNPIVSMWLSQDYPMIYKNYPIILDNSTFTIGFTVFYHGGPQPRKKTRPKQSNDRRNARLRTMPRSDLGDAFKSWFTSCQRDEGDLTLQMVDMRWLKHIKNIKNISNVAINDEP